MKQSRLLPVLLLLLLLLPLRAHAQAEELSHADLVTEQHGFWSKGWLFDGQTSAEVPIPRGSSFTLEAPEGMGALYFLHNWEPGIYYLRDNRTGLEYAAGKEGFLHEYVDLSALFGDTPTSLTISFPNQDAHIAELHVFSAGEAPDFVQRWNPPAEGQADLALFSTHGDDEQLFFGGILPYYQGELGYQVQVIYLTDHRNVTTRRVHEMLDGLWAVGCTTYPVLGSFGDFYTTDKTVAYNYFHNAGHSKEELLEFVVTQLRRFRPMVAVGHDPIKGEYGHGQHMVYAELLMEAVTLTQDPERFPLSATIYSTWDVPKTYLHLWKENPIELNWDIPLSRFGGMTAYQVTRDLGFACHKSQYGSFIGYYQDAATSAQVKTNSPRYYGLYRSTVGPDVQCNDFFENIHTHAQERSWREAVPSLPRENLPPLFASADQTLGHLVKKFSQKLKKTLAFSLSLC